MVDYNWEAAGRTQTRNNLKQIGVALHNYETDEQRFPAGGVFDDFGRPMFSWQTVLLPYIDQAALYNSIQLEVPWDDPANATALGTVVPMYLVPSNKISETKDTKDRALSHYAGNGRVLNAGTGLPLTAFKDGTSNTLMAGEATANSRPWGYPVNWRDTQLGINKSPDGFGSPWKNGATFLMTDGSARFISEEIDPQLLEALSTPDGGEPVQEF